MKKILLFTLVVCLSLTIGALTPVTAENIKQGGTMVVTYKDDVSTLDPAIGYDWQNWSCLLYTSPSPRDRQRSRMPSSA